MQKSINTALLFVIAMSSSIIAVELIPQHRVNSYKLRCAEIAGYNSISFKMSKDLKLFQQNVTPFISIENLLNEDYFDNIRINAFGSRFYEPASGINFVCGLKLQL